MTKDEYRMTNEFLPAFIRCLSFLRWEIVSGIA